MIQEHREHSIGPEVLRYFSAVLARWHAQLPRGRVPASIYKELLLAHRSRAPDLAWESQAATARAIAEPALRAVLQPLVVEYFSEGQRVLEVGAGTLRSGKSYLSRYFDNLPGLAWTFADAREVTVRWAHKIAGTDYRELELVSASDVLPGAGSFDRAVASNVFDTLPYSDFATALSTISRMTRREGWLLHVADLNFYINAFLDACGQPGLVLFPSASSHKLIQAVSKDLYAEIVSSAKARLSAGETEFLNLWGEQSPQIQAVVIGDAFLTGKDLASMARRIETVFAGHLRPLQQVGLFQRSLVTAAALTGWQVVECGFRVAEVTLARRAIIDGSFNRHELDEGAVIGSSDPKVPAGHEKVRAKVHVFVARRV